MNKIRLRDHSDIGNIDKIVKITLINMLKAPGER